MVGPYLLSIMAYTEAGGGRGGKRGTFFDFKSGKGKEFQQFKYMIG